MFLLCLRNQRGTTPCNEIDLERSAMRRSGFVANNSHQCFCTSCGRFSAGALRSKPDEDHGAGVCKGSSFASCSVFLALPRILTVWGVPVDMNRVSIVHGNPAIKLRFVWPNSISSFREGSQHRQPNCNVVWRNCVAKIFQTCDVGNEISWCWTRLNKINIKPRPRGVRIQNFFGTNHDTLLLILCFLFNTQQNFYRCLWWMKRFWSQKTGKHDEKRIKRIWRHGMFTFLSFFEGNIVY